MTQIREDAEPLVELITRFKRAKIDWDGENIADLLWLAKYVDASPSKESKTTETDPKSQKTRVKFPPITAPPPREPSSAEPAINLYRDDPQESEETQQNEKETTSSGIPFKTPTAPALRQTLEIGRSLRPLMRKVDSYSQTELDETATAEQTAEHRFCTTVMRPVRERWLEVALVVEQTPSTFIWEDTIREFRQLLEQQGAFRSIKTWYLQSSGSKGLSLFAQKPSDQTNPSARSYKELIDTAGRRLILLVSDCISPAWWQGQIQEDCLQLWAQNGLVAVVQLLPGKLWGRTALSKGLGVKFEAMNPGMVNQYLIPREIPIWEDPQSTAGLKLPVITLLPTSLQQWSRMVAGFGDSWATGIWFDQGWPKQPTPKSSSLTAEQLVKRFNTTASDTARHLAELISTVPVNLPIIYLIQATMLPESTPLHLAEIVMSGLIRRTDEDQYDFADGVRERLIDLVSVSEAEEVLDRVSQYIGERVGKAIYTFTALLMLEDQLVEAGGTELLQFATVTKQVLRRMGGEYAAIAEAAEAKSRNDRRRPTPPEPTLNFPPLKPLDFIAAKLVSAAEDFSELQTEEFTVATLTLEPVTNKALENNLQSFEFTVATVTQNRGRWSIERRQQQAKKYIEKLSEEVGIEMVAIPGGQFLMGSPVDEKERSDWESPQHEVTVEPFFLGRYPITQAQWRLVAALPRVERELNPDPSRFKGGRLPVESINWYEAVEFCARLSQFTGRHYRLPTEAEWEYACRAGTTTPFHFGETITPEVANYYGKSVYAGGPKGEYRATTTPVEHFGVANDFGLSDMHGNVYEWCQDHWHENYKGAPKNGGAWLTEKQNAPRLRRGGSWDSYPYACRSAYRIYYFPGALIIGLRIACAAPRTE